MSFANVDANSIGECRATIRASGSDTALASLSVGRRILVSRRWSLRSRTIPENASMTIPVNAVPMRSEISAKSAFGTGSVYVSVGCDSGSLVLGYSLVVGLNGSAGGGLYGLVGVLLARLAIVGGWLNAVLVTGTSGLSGLSSDTGNPRFRHCGFPLFGASWCWVGGFSSQVADCSVFPYVDGERALWAFGAFTAYGGVEFVAITAVHFCRLVRTGTRQGATPYRKLDTICRFGARNLTSIPVPVTLISSSHV